MTTLPSSALPPADAWRFRPVSHPRLRAIRAFSDNYIWAILSTDAREVAVVDPGDDAPVRRFVDEHGLRLTAILLTHHHPDHVGGVAALASAGDVRVIGPTDPRVGPIDQALRDDETIELPAFELHLRAIDVPGHTLGHVAFFAEPFGGDPRPLLFAGDTLFAGGCGRLFEGTPSQMRASLARLAALPPDTLVYCAHEYTLSNLRFAAACEPDSADVAARLAEAQRLRANDIETVPSSIGIERATNPFLRWDEPSIRAAASARLGGADADADAVFGAIRAWKNGFG